MQAAPVIKDLHNADSPQIIDLILPIQQLEFGVPITLEGQPDLQDVDGFYYANGGRFWGAVIGDQLVGTIALMVCDGPIGVIRKMFVAKDYRGKETGIAMRLLEQLLTHCHALGISDIYLGTVEMLKAAHRFYERNGFKTIAVAQLPSSFQRMKPDTIFYHLHLS